MRTPSSLMLPKHTKIRNLQEAERIIFDLVKIIEKFNQYVYGDLTSLDKRVTTLEP